MVGFVIVTHGELAAGLLQAARMIIGELPGVIAISLEEGEGSEELQANLIKAIDLVNQGEGVLIFVDLIGASPFNVCGQIAAQHPDIEVITGVNLPMLLETILQRDDHSFEELIQIAVQSGRESIQYLTALLSR